MEKYNEINNLRNNAVKSLFLFIEELYIKYKDDKTVSEEIKRYLTRIFEIFDSSKKIENIRNPFVVNENLVQPILEFNKGFEISEINSKMNDIIQISRSHFINQRSLLNTQKRKAFLNQINFKFYSRQVSIGIKILKGSS